MKTSTMPAWAVAVRDAHVAAMASVDEAVEARRARMRKAGYESSCSKGCASCCYINVTCTLTTAVSMLVEGARVNDVVRSEAASMAASDKVTLKQYASRGVPCAALRDDECSTYAVRPLSCRKYEVVTDPRRCATLGAMIGAFPDIEASVTSEFYHAASHLAHEHGLPFVILPLAVALEWAEVVLRDGAVELRTMMSRGDERLRLNPSRAPMTERDVVSWFAGIECDDGATSEVDETGVATCRLCGWSWMVEPSDDRCSQCGTRHRHLPEQAKEVGVE